MSERKCEQVASAVRRLTEALARADSSASCPHHADFLEQLRAVDPPEACGTELRALWNHARSAAGAGPATPFAVVFAVGLTAAGIVALTVVSLWSTYPQDPNIQTIARIFRLVGLLGVAASCLLAGSRARRVFLRVALPATMAGHLIRLLSAFPDGGRIVAVGDALVRSAMGVGLLGCAAMLLGAGRFPRAFGAGWHAFGASLVLLASGNLVRAADVAGRGETLWVGASSLMVVGTGLLAVSLLRGAHHYRRAIGIMPAV